MYIGELITGIYRGAWVAVLLLASNSILAGPIARATSRLPEIPAPPQARVEWIAQSMRMNGLPMTLQRFESSQPVEAMFAHYARWWSTTDAGAHGVSRMLQRGEWKILALTSPELHITIGAKQRGGGSEGNVAVSRNPSSIEPSTSTSFPHPRTTRVVNLQEYEDARASAEHISFMSARSVSMEAHKFRELLTDRGWVINREQGMQSNARGHILEAQKGANLAHLTFQPALPSGSSIIVIWRKG